MNLADDAAAGTAGEGDRVLPGATAFRGGSGPDVVLAAPGGADMEGGAGDDRLNGSRHEHNSAVGGAGDDVFSGGRAYDRLEGGQGSDVVVGLGGDDECSRTTTGCPSRACATSCAEAPARIVCSAARVATRSTAEPSGRADRHGGVDRLLARDRSADWAVGGAESDAVPVPGHDLAVLDRRDEQRGWGRVRRSGPRTVELLGAVDVRSARRRHSAVVRVYFGCPKGRRACRATIRPTLRGRWLPDCRLRVPAGARRRVRLEIPSLPFRDFSLRLELASVPRRAGTAHGRERLAAARPPGPTRGKGSSAPGARAADDAHSHRSPTSPARRRLTIVAAIFASIFVPPGLQAAVSDDAWAQAMLDAETALAAAQADEGLISREAAEAVAAACRRSYEVGGRETANPVVPLARALQEAAPEAHRGTTSQDILDTAAMLVVRRARALILDELDGVVGACARLAREQRRTPIAGRTLMQQAQPITFGLKAAGWLSGAAAARDDLRSIELAAQLGGPVGAQSPQLAARFAARLGLVAPPLPWHGDRTRVARLGAALAIAAGACEKVALDIVLLSQNEVGEVAESSEGGRGGSSAMAHKRNAVGAVRARAAARSVRGAAGVLLEAMAGEHERAAGAWQSEWGALSAALAGAGGAAWSLREALEGLTINADRMADNLEGLPGELDQATIDGLIDRALRTASAAAGTREST